MKSNSIKVFKEFLASATPQQIEFVDQVYAICEENYEAGGDRVVECWEPENVLEYFKDLEEVKEFCGLVVDQESNARWGEDSDPEVQRSENFENWA